MIAAGDGTRIGPDAAERVFASIADALRDARYVRVGGAPIVLVHDLATLAHPRVVAAAWRSAAAECGIGPLHLCAVQPADAVSPEDMGFDAFLEAPHATGDRVAEAVASAAAPWPEYRFYRSVSCRRDAQDPHAAEAYEFALSAAIGATRRRGETLVFVDAWNDWGRGRYLEPNDRDGRSALLATRRASRGRASGLVLLRQLHDALGDDVDGPAAAVLDELEDVVSFHEHTRDRLMAGVEAALGRDGAPAAMQARPDPARLPSLRCYAYLEHVAGVEGAALGLGPVTARGDALRVTGWAHASGYPTSAIELFLALESPDGGEHRMYAVDTRIARSDVVAAFPDFPADCGFAVTADISDLAAGTYRIAIVQRAPDARYRDATAVVLVRDEAPCSND